MSLVQHFNEVTTQTTTKLSELAPNIKYKVLRAKKLQTKYGESVTLCLKLADDKTAWVFIPKRYICVFNDTEIENINQGHTTVCLEYKGVCSKTKAFLLELHNAV